MRCTSSGSVRSASPSIGWINLFGKSEIHKRQPGSGASPRDPILEGIEKYWPAPNPQFRQLYDWHLGPPTRLRASGESNTRGEISSCATRDNEATRSSPPGRHWESWRGTNGRTARRTIHTETAAQRPGPGSSFPQSLYALIGGFLHYRNSGNKSSCFS